MTVPKLWSREVPQILRFLSITAWPAALSGDVLCLCANTSQYSLHPNNSDCLEISFSYLLFINFSQYFYTEKIVLKTLSITVDERNSV